MKNITVSIVIPNWNGVYLLKKHLQNVINCSLKAEVIVADDMSSDGSVEYVQTYFPNVKVVQGKKQEGFAANVNRGVSIATGEIVILLNTDVEPEKRFIQPLLKHFEDKEVFAVGCMDKSWENGKVVLRGRGLGHWEKGFFVHRRGEIDKENTAWVSGGSGAFRKDMWNQLGGMDTIYNPFYWEDIDVSYRARKAGWKTLFEQKSIVNHSHEEGKIKREFSPQDVKRIAYRNQFIFIWKNVSECSIIFQHMIWTPVRLTQAIVAKDVLMIQGFLWAILYIGVIFKKRCIQKKLYKKKDMDLNT